MSTETPEAWRLLAVDDDPGVLEATAFVLDDFAFRERAVEIRTAASAGEALALVESGYQPAVALIDIVMERENAGLELVPASPGPFRKRRSLPTTTSTPTWTRRTFRRCG